LAYTIMPAPGTISIAGKVITGVGTIGTAYRKGALICVPGVGIGQLADTPTDDLAVGAHVQACFAAEKAIAADIDAGTITTVQQVDADARWPA
jgi:hypothetical protein